MKVIHKHNIYLDKRQSNIYIDVMQADAYTRVLEFSLYSGGVAWNVPEGVDVAVAYIGSSGKGIYDTLPDGTAACDVNGNVVTAVVAPQAVAMDGNTNLNIIFTDGEGHQLAAFCVTLKVEKNPAVNATKPPDYINLRQWMTAELANLVWDYAVNVYPDQVGDGYVSERPYDAILREYESGRAVYCALEISDQERLQLPFVKIDGGVLYFSAVCAGKEYLVTINADGVTVEQSEVGSGGGSGNPGEDGGYYTPTVIDNGDGTMTVSFAASNADMPAVDTVTVVLPEGQKGYSPTANVEQTDSGAIIHIYDKNGHTFATVENGKNGGDGKDGNGIKSAVLNDDYTLTLTFDDGTNYTTPSIRGATGAQGIQGVQGEKGEKGETGAAGAAGADGADGVSVSSVKQTTTSTADGGSNVVTVTLSNGATSTFTVKNGSKGNTGATGATGKDGADGKDGKDYSFDPTAYGLPILHLTGDISPIKVSKDNRVTLDYAYGERSGTCTLKGQGATSYKTAKALVDAGKAGKFNYTIKFDNAFEAKEGWGAQQKYCLKANFIDTTHSRNIVSCKLWGMSVKARSAVPSQLANLPNGGAIDGFPIIIMLNGEFHGLYTWNIPKDGWMFGLVEDTTKTQAIVGADDHTTATQFKEASMTGFEVEFVSDEDNAAWVETSLTRLISAVMNSDGSDLDTTVAQYLDWDSAIDHYIHTVVEKAADCVDKNYLLVTFDGVKWYMSAYDRDSIHGLHWDASGTTRPVSNVSFIECAETVRIYELIKRFKTNALKARYKELRGNILSESRIMAKFENFAWAIPSPVMLEDVKLYPTIMGSGVNTIDQIGRFVRQRLMRCDEWIDALPAQESTGGSTVTTYAVTNALSNCVTSNGATAVNANAAYSATITANDGYTLDGATVTVTMGGTDITSTVYSSGKVAIASVTGAVVITVAAVKKAAGYTNLVPTSTDTDGSIFNGTGYKDNARLSSSGSVSGTALNGSVTTGFIPCKAGDIIRMKGATWLGNASPNLYYILFYDSTKTNHLTGYSAASYNDSYAGVTVEYDETTGITMFDTSTGPSGYLEHMKNAAYFRINAYGKGADLIVTVNEDIT